MGKRQSIAGPVSGRKRGRNTVPRRLLLTDARNDARLERAIARLGRGDALVFRHYHLDPRARQQRFARLARLARRKGILLVTARLAGTGRRDGVYGTAREVAGASGLKLATAHSLAEIGAAVRADADAVLLSPVFATRSHPAARALGPVRFLLLARRCPLPVIALGGMTPDRARGLPVHGWAAIDGLA